MPRRPLSDDPVPHYPGIDRPDLFDTDQFYMRSTDAKGHATSQNIKIEPLLGHAIKVLIHEENLPYRSIADFARDAMCHRAHELMEKSPAFGMQAWRLWAEEKLAIEAFQWEEKITRDTEVVDRYREKFANPNATTEELMGLIRAAEQRKELMPEPRAGKLEAVIQGATARLHLQLAEEGNTQETLTMKEMVRDE